MVSLFKVLREASVGDYSPQPELRFQLIYRERRFCPARVVNAALNQLQPNSGRFATGKSEFVERSNEGAAETFPDWGPSPYYSVALAKTTTVAELLTHLYVLIPVFDNAKHYWVGQDELDKLVEKGQGWLNIHPLKELIARRFLKFQSSLYREALSRLVEEEQPEEVDATTSSDQAEESLERPISLNDQRLGCVMAALRASGAKRVLDLGCGEGKLLRELLKDRQFEQIVGVDVSIRALEVAKDRLRLAKRSRGTGFCCTVSSQFLEHGRGASAGFNQHVRRRERLAAPARVL